MEARTVIYLDAAARRLDHPWLGGMLDALDRRLRRRQGIIEYTRCPNCLFRIQVITSCDDFVLSDGVHVRPSDRLLSLHVWNEQFAIFPARGPTLAWAHRINRAFDMSLRDLAHFLDARRDLDDIKAICGNMAFEPAKRSAQLARYVSRFGFERIAAHGSQSFRRRLQWLCENVLISTMVLSHNARALRADTLWRDRTLVFLSRQALQRRYGSSATKRHNRSLDVRIAAAGGTLRVRSPPQADRNRQQKLSATNS
jgi:YkoP-like protein